jgi:UDP-sulfoquinovose synthase
MKKTVLVCGWDGYIGYALTLRLLERGYSVVGMDNFSRRKYVKSMGSFSATPIDDPDERIEILREIGDFEHLTHDIHDDYGRMCNFLSIRKPDTIVNLAQQPSAPFSFRSREDAVNTTKDNILGTLNMLYYMKEFAPDAQLIQIGSMGEYDPAMGTDIPEGTFDLQLNGKIARNVIFPRRPGSWYHASKVASTYHIDCACRWWGLKATDIMQGVVYGNWTPEIEKYNTHTRLDSDESFGTVVNRFIVQALLGVPLTIFGEGLQSRGYLALNDSVQCLMLAIENPPVDGEYRTWNQLDEIWNIVALAGAVKKVGKKFGIKVESTHIPSPRAEATHDFSYTPHADKMVRLGFEQTREVEQEVEYMFRVLAPVTRSELYPLENVVDPKITWK